MAAFADQVPIDASTIVRNFDLTNEVYKLDHFKVTGEREGNAAAITAQRNAPNVKNIVAIDAYGNLPNMNASELAILLARIKGLVRRSGWLRRARDRYAFAGKTIDFDTLELRVGDRTLPLTLMEANLLRYLTEREGKAVSRKAMLEEVWGVREDTDTRAIDNFIVRLRRYIELEPANPQHLLTVRGVGYRFVAEPKG